MERERLTPGRRYRAVIFDVDGTLYDQRRLRLIMAAELALYYCLRPAHLWEARALAAYRKSREAFPEEPEAERVAAAAQKFRVPDHTVRRLVEQWMQKAPLPHLFSCRDRRLAELISALRARGTAVAAYSDYPAADKLRALRIQVDGCFCAADSGILRLKPDPAGLRAILKAAGLSSPDCLMVGDRLDRDGKAAENAAMDYLILPAGFGRERGIRRLEKAVGLPH